MATPLVDAFDGTALGAQWAASTGVIALSAGRVSLAAGSVLLSSVTVDLTGMRQWVEVDQIATTAGTVTTLAMASGANALRWRIVGTGTSATAQAELVVGGVTTAIGSPVSFSAGVLQWRETAGKVYFEHAPSLTATMTAVNPAGIAPGFAVTALAFRATETATAPLGLDADGVPYFGGTGQMLGLDTDGVPYFAASLSGAPRTVAADTDGVPYFA